jgi:aspartyl-tRNA(Asn)/glutamyl-tRNA(Gln) amidotransferase subunit B
VARWIVNELPPALGDRELADVRLTGAGLAALVAAVESGEITGQVAKEVFAEMVDGGADPRQVIAGRGLTQVSDEGAIAAIVDRVLADNGDKVEQYHAGKAALLGYFVGQAIKASQGRANPQIVQAVVRDRLG